MFLGSFFFVLKLIFVDFSVSSRIQFSKKITHSSRKGGKITSTFGGKDFAWLEGKENISHFEFYVLFFNQSSLFLFRHKFRLVCAVAV